MHVSFEKFRCFGEPQTAPVRPLTILVGENSAGKSSFLAGFRYIYEFTSGERDVSFNKDPFFLGGYRSIAHSRGGRHGTASSFKLGLERGNPRSSRKGGDLTLFEVTFADEDGDCKPTEFGVSKDGKSVRVSSDIDWTAAVEDENIKFEHKVRHARPAAVLGRHPDFFGFDFFLREIVFSSRLEDKSISNDEKIAIGIIEEILNHTRRISSRRSGSLTALAPVRTRPQRNYDPTQLGPSSEGDQLISNLGKMARLDTHRWAELKDQLEKYGRETGLFEEIKVQKLGKSETDPFQILVKKQGKQINIIDMGYGISQILPLFVMMSNISSSETILIQQPEVHLHPSAQAALGEVIAKTAKEKKFPNLIIETHSDFFMDRVLSCVQREIISSRDVSILFFEKNRFNSKIHHIEIGSNGELIDPPDAYRSFFMEEAFRSLGI
ncbi:MAG: AAA family ATPase [Pseudomonadota bacterium]